MIRAIEFLARTAAGVSVVFVLWLPLTEPTLVLVARGAETVLSWAWSPPLVTGLHVTGATIDVRGILVGADQWMGRFSGANLPLFLIAALGVAVAAPSRDLPARLVLIAGTCVACSAVLVVVTAVEATTVAANGAAARLHLHVLTDGERRWLESVRGSVDLLQMLLPATVALVGYAPKWFGDRAVATTPTPWWHAWLAWGGVALFVCGLTLPEGSVGRRRLRERLERTASQNPESGPAWLAVATVRRAELDAALDAYRHALAAGADASAVQLGMVDTLLAHGRPAEALVWAETPARGAAPSPALRVSAARALLRLGRPCDALSRLRRSSTSRSEEPVALRRLRERAERACRRRAAG